MSTALGTRPKAADRYVRVAAVAAQVVVLSLLGLMISILSGPAFPYRWVLLMVLGVPAVLLQIGVGGVWKCRRWAHGLSIACLAPVTVMTGGLAVQFISYSLRFGDEEYQRTAVIMTVACLLGVLPSVLLILSWAHLSGDRRHPQEGPMRRPGPRQEGEPHRS
jgi:hypothetical protein